MGLSLALSGEINLMNEVETYSNDQWIDTGGCARDTESLHPCHCLLSKVNREDILECSLANAENTAGSLEFSRTAQTNEETGLPVLEPSDDGSLEVKDRQDIVGLSVTS